MRTLYKVISVIIYISIYIFISFSCSTPNRIIGYNLNTLTASFVVVEQDTISFGKDNELFNYSIMVDSIGRKFFVLEDGCNNTEYRILKNISVNDTISLTIHLVNPYRFEPERKQNYRGPDLKSIIITAEDGNHLEVYQTNQLCKHQYLVLNN